MTEEKILEVVCGSPDNPLRISDIEIPCYVLEDETRVLVHRSMVAALGMARGGSSKGGGDRLLHFVNGSRIKPFINNSLLPVIEKPLKFRAPNGSLAYGYEATVLAEICFAVIDADDIGLLQQQQKHIADRCRILVRGFAVVGINALVDEATGYQDVRVKNALAKILEKYIAKEYRAWTKTFPDEFYHLMFKLKNWPLHDPGALKRPSVVGRYTNDIVYQRLAPGVLTELRRVNPANEKGNRPQKHHQWLTNDIGHPELHKHLNGVIALMRAATNWDQFKRMVQRAYPKPNEQMLLDLE